MRAHRKSGPEHEARDKRDVRIERRVLAASTAPESGFQERKQALRNRLVEEVIIERMKKVLAIGIAGKKVANIAVDRGNCDRGLYRKAFYGEMHGGGLLLRLLTASLTRFG
jgi:hypothetical protein